jgi:hypothetical protein
MFIALFFFYRSIISRAKKQAREIHERTEIEKIKIKENLERQKAELEYEYTRKNIEKTIELEALRKKIKILKKNIDFSLIS